MSIPNRRTAIEYQLKGGLRYGVSELIRWGLKDFLIGLLVPLGFSVIKLHFVMHKGHCPCTFDYRTELEEDEKESFVEATVVLSTCELKSDASRLEHRALQQAGIPSSLEDVNSASSTLTV